MRRLRLLWVTPQLPRRGVSAARERWWQLLGRLASRHAVTLLAFVDPRTWGRRACCLPGWRRPISSRGARIGPRILSRSCRRRSRAGSRVPDFRAAVAARLAADAYDVVQYEFTEAAYCIPPGTDVRSVLTVHQVGFAQERPAWRAAGGGPRMAAVRFHRWLRELDFGLGAVGCVDRVVTMSSEDAARLRRFHADLPLSVSPCGVDCDELRPPPAPEPPAVDLVFLGHFGHPPNVDAVQFLVRDVMPRLGRPVRLRIVGRGVVPAVAALARPGSVEIAGAVDDVRPHLRAGAVFVAPVRFGTGMRGKVLEALALGRPVVTTTVGAEGLAARPGSTCWSPTARRSSRPP
jgi:glycosyltransferase involved in cell wall biosynthesis